MTIPPSLPDEYRQKIARLFKSINNQSCLHKIDTFDVTPVDVMINLLHKIRDVVQRQYSGGARSDLTPSITSSANIFRSPNLELERNNRKRQFGNVLRDETMEVDDVPKY